MSYKFLSNLTVINSTFSPYNSGGTANDSLKVSSSNLGASFGVQNTNASGYAGIEYIDNSGNVKVFTGFNNSNGQEFRFNNIATGGYIGFLIGSTSALRIFNTRNIGIGTTTDAGYMLDVAGNSRISSGGNTRLYIDTTSGTPNTGFALSVSGTAKWTVGAYKPSGTNISYVLYNEQTGTNSLFIQGDTNNVIIGSTTDAGYKLDVLGTTRFGGNSLVSLNQNAETSLIVSNTTSGTSSSAQIKTVSSGGGMQLGKYSATTTTYKSIASNDGFLYNYGIGNISILNDYGSGNINFTSRGSSSAQVIMNGDTQPLALIGAGSSNFSMNSGNDVYFAFNSQSAVGRFYANPQGTVQYTYDQPTSVGFVGTLAGASVWYGNMNASGGAVKYNCSLNGTAHSHIWYYNFSEQMRLQYTGNLLIGTSTDAGYKLDVNGTARINSTFYLTNSTYAGTFSFYLSAANTLIASSANIGTWLQVGGGNNVSIVGQAFNSTSRGNNFGNTVGGEAISATTIIAQSSGTTATTGLSLRYTINNTGTYSGISRGIYYNPTVTSLTGTTHRAIETVVGDVIFGSTSGNVGIGTTSPAYKLDVNGTARATALITDTVTTSGSTTLAGYSGSTYTYGPITADQSSYTLTFGAFPILFGSITSGYIPKANTIGMGNSAIYNSGANNILINSTTDTGYKLQVNGSANVNTGGTNNNLLVTADTSAFYNLSNGGQVQANVYTTSVTTRYTVPGGSSTFLFEWDVNATQGIFVDYVIMVQGPNWIRSGTLVIANDNAGNVTLTDNINASVNGSTTAFVTFTTVGTAAVRLACNNALMANDAYVNIITRYIPTIY